MLMQVLMINLYFERITLGTAVSKDHGKIASKLFSELILIIHIY